MNATTDYRAAAAARDYGEYGYAPRGSNWIVFACCMLGLAGIWNVIDGFLAIGSSHVYVGHQTFVFSDLNTWGWIFVVVGCLQLVAAMAVAAGSEMARWFGIAVAGLNAIVQLSFIPAYPWWSMMMFAVDVLVIFALASYGGKQLRQE
jgi:hypothetical protein